MKSFKSFIQEAVPFSSRMFGSVLTKDIEKYLIDMKNNLDNDAKYNRIQRKAKKEFQRLRLSGVDYYGFMDAFYTYYKDKK